MEELQIEREHGYTKELKHGTVDKPMLRVYKDSPRSVKVQIRTNGPITDSGNGKARKMISGMSLNADEARRVIAQLELFLATQTDDSPLSEETVKKLTARPMKMTSQQRDPTQAAFSFERKGWLVSCSSIGTPGTVEVLIWVDADPKITKTFSDLNEAIAFIDDFGADRG